jgi:glycerol-3-phosphate O-acyltransferase
MAGGITVTESIQLYCDVDETGKITRLLSGEKVIPTSQFKYFFMITRTTELNLDKFYVNNGELIQIEGTTLIEVVPEKPTSEQELEDMKKRMAELEKTLANLSNT